MEREALDELWTRHLSGERLSAADARALAAALESNDGLRAEMQRDAELDGMLSALGRSAHDAEAFAQLFLNRLRAEDDQAQFVARFQQRIAQEGYPAARTPLEKSVSGRSAANGRSSRRLRSSARRPQVSSANWMWPVALAGAVAAILAIVLTAGNARVKETPAIAHEKTPVTPAPLEPAPAAEKIATVVSVAGKVHAVTAAGRTPLKSGDALTAGQGIATEGADSAAELAFADGTRVQLAPDTLLSNLSDIHGKHLTLESGDLSAAVAKQSANAPLLIATPQAEIRVLGTHFSLSVANEQSRLEVTEGAVRLTRQKDKASVDVPAGNYAIAAEGVELVLHAIVPIAATAPVVATPVVEAPAAVSSIHALAFSPDGKTLAAGGLNGPILLWDVPGWRERPALNGHRQTALSLAFSRDGSLLATGSPDQNVRLWSASKWELSRIIARAHDEGVQTLAFSPDGKTLATGGKDKKVKLWDSAGLLRATLDSHADHIRSIAYSADGALLVSSAEDKLVIIWDAASGKPRTVLKQDSIVRSVSCAPKQALFACGDASGKLRVLSLADGAEKAQVQAHATMVRFVAYAPDGGAIVTASDDHVARLWDATTLKLSQTLRGHRDSVSCAAFSPDGKFIATSSLDRSVKIWDRKSGELIRTFNDPETKP